MKIYRIDKAAHEGYIWNTPEIDNLNDAIQIAHELAERSSFITDEILETENKELAEAEFKKLKSSAYMAHRDKDRYLWNFELYVFTENELIFDEEGDIEDDIQISEIYSPLS